eukprot:SAG31_NODE_22434_length_525_cov_1.546948_1_plen_98_part_10
MLSQARGSLSTASVTDPSTSTTQLNSDAATPSISSTLPSPTVFVSESVTKTGKQPSASGADSLSSAPVDAAGEEKKGQDQAESKKQSPTQPTGADEAA